MTKSASGTRTIALGTYALAKETGFREPPARRTEAPIAERGGVGKVGGRGAILALMPHASSVQWSLSDRLRRPFYRLKWTS